MKFFFLPLFAGLVVFACTKEKPVTINGKITGSSNESFTIDINYLDRTDTVGIAEDGSFSTQLIIDDERFATMRCGNIGVALYLVPGATINMELDNEDFKNNWGANANITGKYSEPTTFLLNLKTKTFNDDIEKVLRMPVDSFALKVDKLIKISEEEIGKFKSSFNASKKFIDLLELYQHVNIAQYYYYNYINYHKRLVPEDTASIPEVFQAYIDDIPVDDFEKCKELREYKSFVIGHYINEIREELQSDSTLKSGTVAYENKNIDAILALNIPQDLKDVIGYRLVSSYSYRPDSIREVQRKRYKELISNEKYVNEFETVVASIEKTKPGAIAPSFNYADIDGNMVSSDSFIGKVVYIDVWATWCGPCRVEIPALKTMEEKLHNQPVAFVSISIDSDKAAWGKMVKEEALKGYQLFAEGAWGADIIKAYAIRGIPRFIIIDKEGKIVNANASRPSNPATKEKLLELAAK